MRNIVLILFICTLCVTAYSSDEKYPHVQLSPNQFKKYLEEGRILSIRGRGDDFEGICKQINGEEIDFVTINFYENSPFLEEAIAKQGLEIEPTIVKSKEIYGSYWGFGEIFLMVMIVLIALLSLFTFILQIKIIKKLTRNKA